jgi:hypothetical protein
VRQRASAARSQRKLQALSPSDNSYTGALKRRAQKAATTRTANKLQAAKESGRRRIKPAARDGVIRAAKRKPETAAQKLARLNPEAAKRMAASDAKAAKARVKRSAKRGNAKSPDGGNEALARRQARARAVSKPGIRAQALSIYRAQRNKYGTAGVPKAWLKRAVVKGQPTPRVRLARRDGVIKINGKKAPAMNAAPAAPVGGKKAVRGRTVRSFYSTKKDGVMLKKVVDAIKDKTLKSGDLKGNLAKVIKLTERQGFKAEVNRAKNAPGAFVAKIGPSGMYDQKIKYSSQAGHWDNPGKNAANNRRSRWWSTAAPLGAMHHEIGHAKYYAQRKGPGAYAAIANSAAGRRQIVSIVGKRVSQYASKSPSEFVAETYAGLRTGQRYDPYIMKLYKELMGPGAVPKGRPRRRRR